MLQVAKTPSAERLPPQSVDVEKSLLACMLMDNEAINSAVEVINDRCFYREDHRLIYLAILALNQRNEPADLLTVTEELRKRKQLEKVGEEMYLAEILETASTSANARYYAKILLEKATLRDLISATQAISGDCYEASEDAERILDRAESNIFSISESRIRQGFVSIKGLLPQTFIDIERYSSGQVAGVPSGFDELDTLTSGFQPTNLVIIAARPGIGKTSFALSVMLNVALRHNKSAALFSLEMSKEEIAQRLLCAEARVSMHRLRSGHLPKRDYPKLSLAAGPLAEASLYVDDSAAMNVLELRAKARRLKRQDKVDIIFVDYLQLMRGTETQNENRQQEIAQISRSLKALAKELNLPVVALSQLSRQVEQRGKGARPQLSDLRESGAIEQDADVVLFLHRTYGGEEEGDDGAAELIIGKQRNGPTGSMKIAFVREYARFESLSPREDAGGFE